MYGANGSFMKLRLLLFRRVFPFAYKNALPTLNAFPARLPGGISHVRFDFRSKKDRSSIGEDTRGQLGKG